jgi:peptidoglycan/xylan/chitin deacetylase (PgdA/CDA1 family)
VIERPQSRRTLSGVIDAVIETFSPRWAAERKAWLILYTHDVADSPSPWGCTPEALGHIADAAKARGFDIVTAAAGARRLGL